MTKPPDPSAEPRTAVELLAHYEGMLRVQRDLGLPTSDQTLTTHDLLLVIVAQGRRIAELERRLSDGAP